MIGPYLAVILDSFRAALSSRVLWIAFVAIWILLAALAPIGYREDFTTTFRWSDFESGTQLKQELGQAIVGPSEPETPVKRIAAAMPESLKVSLRRVGEQEEVRIRLDLFADAFNEMLEDESWYDAEVWASTLQLRELRELNELPDGELSDSLRRRRARLRIEAAFPGVFRSRSTRSVMFTYAGIDFPATLAVDKQQFISLINQWVMPLLINWLLGFVLVFLGILVTASIVPDMLQPGSLHLLLSKPVARPLLLISKFIGGCAFVFLCVLQLVVGLWLIAGFRLDIWNARLLWCIPVSVFLFSVFYSVSVLAGLRWRSPILAIGVTCMFGAITLITGMIGGLFDGLVTRPQTIRGLTVVGQHLVASTRGGGLIQFQLEQSQSWTSLIESDAMDNNRVFPPVDVGDGFVATANSSGGRFNPYGSGAIELLVWRPAGDEEPQPSVRLPRATTRIYRCGQDHLLAEHTGGLQIAERDAIVDAVQRGQPSDEEKAVTGWLSWLGADQNNNSRFKPILPDQAAIASPSAIVPSIDGETIYIVSRGRLLRLERPADALSTWKLSAECTIAGEAAAPVHAAVTADVVLVARDGEPLRLFDSRSLEIVAELPLADGAASQDVTGLGDSGRFVLLTKDGRGHVLLAASNEETSTTEPLRFGRQLPHSDIESMAFDAATNTLAVAHQIDRVDLLRADTLESITAIRPELHRWRFIDYYVVRPLRLIIPQTGELGETVTAIISGKSAVSVDSGPGDEEEIVRYQILRPVFSCAVFITVALSVGCIYFSRRDY